MKPETSVKSESDCDKKEDDVTKEMMLAENFTLKELWDISQRWKHKG